MYSYGGLWIIIGLIALALFLALIVALIVVAISSSNRNKAAYTAPAARPAETRPEDPLEILRRRYARGEITRDEYQSMREDLSH